MKTSKTFFGLLAGLLLMVGLTSCDTGPLTDAVDDFTVVIGLEEINSGATVLFTDAATGQLIDQPVSITFAGDNEADVIDFYSDPIQSDEVSDGILNFGIANSVVPTPENPAEVTLQLSAPGYISANKTVSLADTGFVDFSFSLVNKNNKPSGVKSTTASASTNEDGSLSEDLSVSSESNDANDNQASLTIPSGTAMTDADGNTLSGQLTAEMTNYDPGDPSALSNLPVEIETEDGEPATLLGMSEIQVTDEKGQTATGSAGTQKAKGEFLATSYTVDVAVSDQAGLEIGDVVGFNASDWAGNLVVKLEPPAQIIDLGNGRKGVRATLDFLPKSVIVYTRDQNLTYYNNPTIQRNGYDEGAVKGIAYSYGTSLGFTYPSANPLIIFRTTSDFYEIHLSAPVDHVISYSSLPSQPLTISLPQAPDNLVDAQVDVSVGCANPNERVAIKNISQASLVYRKVGTDAKWRVITEVKWDYNKAEKALTGASTTMYGVEEGQTYEYILKIGSEDPYEGEVTVTDSDTSKEGVQVKINENDITSSICS